MTERVAPLAGSSFRIARGRKWAVALFAPLLAGGFGWLAWFIVAERMAGKGWADAWPFVLLLAALAGLVLLFLAALVVAFRGKLEIGEAGLVLRELFRTRAIPWQEVAGYRWINGQMNLYLVGRELPVNLGYFEQRERLYELFRALVPDLDAAELEEERREIHEDQSLGLTEAEKAARLAELRRIVRPINWSVYVAAALGGANAMFSGFAAVQIAAACVLIAGPFALLLLAVAHPGHVRLGHREGSAYADGLSGIFWGSLILGLMSLMDPHTLLGVEIYYWTAAVAAGFGGLWLYADWARLVEHVRSYVIVLAVVGVGFFSGLWAGGTIYLVNTAADFSAATWGESRVSELRTRHSRRGDTHVVTVEPWSASREPVELEVSRETYQSLHTGMRVELGVRAGLLGIPWVETVRPRR